MRFVIKKKNGFWIICSENGNKETEIPAYYSSPILAEEVADELNRKYRTKYKAELPEMENEK